VASWVKTREEKTGVVAEYNKDIKGLEEAIEALSAEIEGNAFQPSLPLGPETVTLNEKLAVAHTPTVTLDDSDPDVQAVERGAPFDEALPPVMGNPKLCQEGGGTTAVTATPGEGVIKAPQPPAQQSPDDPAGVTAPAGEGEGTTLKRPSYPSPDDVCLCGDLRSDHRDGTGCDMCECSDFCDSDPLGIANVGAEKQEAEL
jgi:hypothetical protein